MAKRGVDARLLDIGKPEKISGDKLKQAVKIRNGIEQTLAKRIVALVKESRLKVTASIQGDAVRIAGAKKDALQECIALLRTSVTEVPLTFENSARSVLIVGGVRPSQHSRSRPRRSLPGARYRSKISRCGNCRERARTDPPIVGLLLSSTDYLRCDRMRTTTSRFSSSSPRSTPVPVAGRRRCTRRFRRRSCRFSSSATRPSSAR
jgi:hypothetical protein